MSYFDDIVAPITGPPPAAVAIVRLSGPRSWDIASGVFSRPLVARTAVFGRFSSGDEGLALAFEEGRSFTGERSVELNTHGSRASIERLIADCLALGARMARPGEFTERAFLNGRIDLTQAEGIRDTIEAVTDAQMRQANLLRDGALRTKVDRLRDGILRELATIEAHVDFSEEIGALDRPAMVHRLSAIVDELDSLLETADAGRFLRAGVRIALAGLPNAGKSSLMNALLGRDRAIVTPIAGTTRDYLEESLELAGVLCVLTDTAGLRTAKDTVEEEGIFRARSMIDAADVVWFLYDASSGWTSADQVEFEGIERPKLKIANKIDLQPDATESYSVSAKTGTGIDRLGDWLCRFAMVDRAASEPLVNLRQSPYLKHAATAILSAIETIRHDLPEDLACVQLRSAAEALGSVTGASSDEDMLERIFRDFCIGK